jgi:ribosomal protein S4
MQLTSKSWRDSFVEKQAVKAYYYSFNETFMKRLWRSESGKIVNVIKNLESRLTTFLVTNNFAQSPLQAHQWISHKHVKVNNVIVNATNKPIALSYFNFPLYIIAIKLPK